MELISNGIQFGVKFLPRGLKRRLGELSAGKGGTTASSANLMEKINKGTATWKDYADVGADVLVTLGTTLQLVPYMPAKGVGKLFYGAGTLIGGANLMDTIINNEYVQDVIDALSFGFNPFDPRWQGKDPDWLEDIKDYWKDFFNPTADPQLYDPITLDLNGDGKISTLNLSDGVYFDH
ncbi:hypothetical protein F1B92_08540, partial [Campylobacter sp. FMV-PI01]